MHFFIVIIYLQYKFLAVYFWKKNYRKYITLYIYAEKIQVLYVSIVVNTYTLMLKFKEMKTIKMFKTIYFINIYIETIPCEKNFMFFYAFDVNNIFHLKLAMNITSKWKIVKHYKDKYTETSQVLYILNYSLTKNDY